MNTIPSITANAFNIERGNYYPFGMEQPERISNSPEYRYGFNGMEKDDEVTNTSGNSYTTYYRQYDPRLGRWKSIDPRMSELPMASSYMGMANNPIGFNDQQGNFTPIVIGVYYLSASAVAWLAAGTTVSVIAFVNKEEIAEAVIGASNALMSLPKGLAESVGTPPTYANFNGKISRQNPFPNGTPNGGKLGRAIAATTLAAVVGSQIHKQMSLSELEGIKIDKDNVLFESDGTSVVLEGVTADVNSDTNSLDVTVQVSINHKIQDGDNLTRIAEKFNTTIDSILQFNPSIENKDSIYTGNTIKVGQVTQQSSLRNDGE